MAYYRINSSGSKICVDANGWHIWSNTQGHLIVNGPTQETRYLNFPTIDDGITWLFMTGRKEIARFVNKAKHEA
jgi:hypothetical protein